MKKYFEKKTEIARDLLSKDVEDIRKLDVKKRIVTCTDCGYANKEMVDFSRGLGTFYILGVKGNTAIALKRKNKSVSDYFLDKKLKKRTIDEKEVYFTEANLNLKNFGQQRIFMIKTSKNAKMKFFITNIRKSKPETIIRISKRRWDDEQGHKDLKQYCGFCKRWTRKRNMQRIHINLSYYLYNALSTVRSRFKRLGEDLSIGKIVKRFIKFSESLIRPVVDFKPFYSLFITFGG